MRKLIKSTKYFHEKLFSNDNVIVDNEIANDISSDWDYEKGVPVVVGILHKDKIVIFIKENEDDILFNKEVVFTLQQLAKKNKIYGFNYKFEQGNFKGQFGFDLDMAEIKPFRAKGWNKDRFFDELLAKEVIPDCGITDIFDGDASLCPVNWIKYQQTGQFEYMLNIVKHNMNCLLKESVILNHKDYFLENYKINEKGWLVE